MNADTSIQREIEDEISTSFIEKDWTLELHGTLYNISICVKASVLTLDVEAVDSCDRWSNEFSSQCKLQLVYDMFENSTDLLYSISNKLLLDIDVEEITQKAGSFKKFNVFVKMLASAFSKESESVFADILTYSDLEMLKARKLGSSSASTSHSLNESRSNVMKSHLKRYLILTYAGEFDRVHYPLPLAFQDDTNIESLKRTIQRLRKRLDEQNNIRHTEEIADPNKDRQIIAQLRQENTELRHRLRQAESRSAKLLSNSPSVTNTTELMSQNAKLKKLNESLKKEITDISTSHEKYRVEVTKELLRWKQQCSDLQLSKYGTNSRYNSPMGSRDDRQGGKDEIIRNLKRRIVELERNQFFDRQHRAQSNRYEPNKSPSSSTGRNKTLSGNLMTSNSRSTSPYVSSNRRPSNILDTTQSKMNTSFNRSTSRPRSNSPSSTLGRVFDPTEYQRQKQMKNQSRVTPTRSISPSVSRRPSESGYSSQGSQSSVGSRRSQASRLSAGSRRSGRLSDNVSSEESDSASYGRLTTRRKVGKPDIPVTRNTNNRSLGIALNSDNRPQNKAVVANKREMGPRSRANSTERENMQDNNQFTKSSRSHYDSSNFMPTHSNLGSKALRASKESIMTKSIEDSIKQLSRSLDKSDASLRASQDSNSKSQNGAPATSVSTDISDIDKRIQALQSFLDNARSGIATDQTSR